MMKLLWIAAAEQNEQPANNLRFPAGFEVECAAAWDGLERLRASQFASVLVSLPLAEWHPEDLLEQIQRLRAVPVVFYAPNATAPEAVRLMKLGAYHLFTGSEDPEQVIQILETAAELGHSRDIERLALAVEEPWGNLLVGGSRAIRGVMEVIRLVGPRRCTVLISGETGSGKELVARAIHQASERAHQPMVAVNCSALPENLLEAELFGHVKGAFTGAINHRVGRFEQAHRGTLLLDEVGDLPLDIQAKLLRVLQEREFQRVGSSETVKVDVRVIGASNIDLAQAVRQGRFREDLYYRLNVVPIRVPSLRERKSDIPMLVRHLIDKICIHERLSPRAVSRETLDRLAGYDWPGNVRQLENAVEMAIALSGDRETLYPADFPLPVEQPSATAPQGQIPYVALPDEGLNFEEIVAGMERTILEQALRKTGGNKAQAAEMLRLKRTTLSAKLKSLALPA